MERTPLPCPFTVVALWRHGSQCLVERPYLEGSAGHPNFLVAWECFLGKPGRWAGAKKRKPCDNVDSFRR